MSQEPLRQDIKEILARIANRPDVSPESIGDEQPLFRDGLALDSIDILELVVQLERRYGLKIKNDAEGQSTFRDVKSLTETVRQHLAARH